MKKILVVDDEPQLRELFSHALEVEGYTVKSAVDGEEALAIVSSFQPDLILLDLNMPNMDGWTAASHLKASPATSHILLLALTSSTLPEEIQRGLDMGCDAYLTKPLLPQELLHEIAFLLDEPDTGFGLEDNPPSRS
jgi:two-component system, cell cycle response regulator DivK